MSPGTAGMAPRVAFGALAEDYRDKRAAIDAAVSRVLRSGWFVLGEEVRRFEEEFACAMGVGHVVAQVGPVIGPCGFSSLAATREWLKTDMAKAFVRAYRKTRLYMNETPAAAIARAEKPYFPDVDEEVLADCIATYQKLGCWTPHVDITRAAYEKTLDVFEYNGQLKQRYRYEQVCAAPPAID